MTQPLTIDRFSKQLSLHIDSAQSRHYQLAVSGGLDSVVLLDLLVQLRGQWSGVTVEALHVNHGLSAQAQYWAEHVAALCANYQIPLKTQSVHLQSDSKQSLEEQARALRYRAFQSHSNPGDVLLTAHHADDQVETMLLNLFNGAGLRGLASMPSLGRRWSLEHCRPLLPWSRQELEVYATSHDLRWVDDKSNQDTQFGRNYLRHEVLPRASLRWPTLSRTMARSISHVQDAQLLLDELAEQDYILTQGKGVELRAVLELKELLQLSERRQVNLLRWWFHRLEVLSPSAKVTKQIIKNLLLSRWDAQPLVEWGAYCLRRYKSRLYLGNRDERVLEMRALGFSLEQVLNLPAGGGELSWRAAQAGEAGLSETRLNTAHIELRYRQGGEALRPQGRAHRQPLKALFQQWSLLPWQRSRVPLLYANGELVAVADRCIAHDWSESEEGKGLLLSWKHDLILQ